MIAPHPVRVGVAMTNGADAEKKKKKKWATKAKEDKARREEVIWNAYLYSRGGEVEGEWSAEKPPAVLP